MTTMRGAVADDRLPYLVFIGLSLAIIVLAGVLYRVDSRPFQKYLGSLNPLVTIFCIALFGLLPVRFLLSRGWFVINAKAALRGVLLSAILAALFAAIMVLVDRKVVFSASLNVPFPQSLLFYPAIGYVVEILFHILPLAVLLFSLTSLFKITDYKVTIWLCILGVSLLEPIYQTLGFVGKYPVWSVVYVGLHLLLFNLLQLSIFRRYDFISMYSFRLVYYLLWHVVWGHVRLGLLFHL